MKPLALMTFVVMVAAALLVSGAAADNSFPSAPATAGQPPNPALSKAQQQIFYGYVPPPPIRHTWPGGYRAIIHEMFNNLMEHMTGHY
ncbi:MAG: hypothetical protein HY913_06515 [Desulfomonile tiedjei]|nr:hypothetical protein [Desulfomonile tiedjei]